MKKKDLIQVLSVNNSDCLQKEKTEKSKRTRSRSRSEANTGPLETEIFLVPFYENLFKTSFKNHHVMDIEEYLQMQ